MSASTQIDTASKPAAKLLSRTSDQILGPFYPLGEPAKGGDLTRVPGRPGRAQGQVIRLTGRVLDRTGEPVRRGKLQIWQANTFGRYVHPNDDNSAPLDECFEGFAVGRGAAARSASWRRRQFQAIPVSTRASATNQSTRPQVWTLRAQSSAR